VFSLQRLSGLNHDTHEAMSKKIAGISAEVLRLAACTDLPILLWGDTGEPAASIARFIHDHGTSSEAGFAHLRAGSLKKGEIATRLGLGTQDGGRIGQTGTVYLDEITNLPAEVQEELTSYLESDCDGGCSSRFPVRLISSTSRSIEAAVRTGTISERLYFRLAGVILPLPSSKIGRAIPDRPFTTWIVAELKQLQGSLDGQLYRHILRLLQASLIQVGLERTGGNQVRAARLLGVNRNTLRKWACMADDTW
jgi:two-component system nitrogen regulation response regulator GlnG